ncbi:alpha-L-arabinofuranosidase [Streptomyces phaeoluteigriseus]|uniref:Alpha-L-arabinofuranosidase n=1 Tax=Streptomyces phaeoluteigriseus TaxID=114686 RepID=A0A1V6MQ62_9ACTN|nr:AbfB domain-containing protein [Streptomyces phaeoluteigriseus]OQD54568.1 alpha-L-arabinofuranosidase [Streptomyces phaeoluteigriseus]
MPDNKSRPPQEPLWEHGWAPDTSRAPGTRRLWLAGVLAVATVVACVATVSLTDRPSDERSASGEGRTTSDKETSSGLISFASPTVSGSPSASATQRGASPSASASSSASPSPNGGSPASASASPSPSAPAAGGGSDPEPAVVRRSVQSVNHPDRHWRVGDGRVRLEVAGGSEFRADATFTVVKGLADASCHSFRTSDGTHLRHRDFVLRAERDDGSSLFRQDATFCARASHLGAVMLESVNYPGYFLRHQNFQVKLERYEHGGQYASDSAFRLVEGLA